MAVAVAGVLALLAALHAYWATGGRRGWRIALPESGGRPLIQPSARDCLVVALALACAAFVVAAQGFGTPGVVPALLLRAACFGVGAVLLVRAAGDRRYIGFLKRVRGTRFARLDTWLYSPLCLLLGLGALVVAVLGGRR
ncbi:MAG: DUF3995 domain-containing protein [Thermoanaerobaculia bacterium]|nr:MAG: DUF3995 domain-containing protein [Thermoanaerobaculia bacterium]